MSKDGGPAFPRTVQHFNDYMEAKDGMSLRDWFAGQVINGLYSNAMLKPSEPDGYVSAAYEVADAMLAERDKNK